VVPNSTTAVPPPLLSAMKAASSSSLRNPLMLAVSCMGAGTGCGCMQEPGKPVEIYKGVLSKTPTRFKQLLCRLTLGMTLLSTLVVAVGGWKLCESQPASISPTPVQHNR